MHLTTDVVGTLVLFTVIGFYLVHSQEAVEDDIPEAEVDSEWQRFKARFHREYADSEKELSRKNIFKGKMKKLLTLRQKYPGLVFELNGFADETPEERKKRNGGRRTSKTEYEAQRKEAARLRARGKSNRRKKENALREERPKRSIVKEARMQKRSAIPASVDWRLDLGVIGPVAWQGKCGSCWAFATLAATEARYRYRRKNSQCGANPVNLSEQELVDCAPQEVQPFKDFIGSSSNDGCDGAQIPWPFLYLIDYYPSTESAYPYSTQTKNNAVAGSCTEDENMPVVTDLSVDDFVCTDNAEVMKEELAINGSIAITMDVNHDVITFYKDGVIDDIDCTTDGNHAMSIVGYGEENGKQYWLVKNSWDTWWGVGGYMKIVRGKNMCGVESFACWPVIGEVCT